MWDLEAVEEELLLREKSLRTLSPAETAMAETDSRFIAYLMRNDDAMTRMLVEK